MTPSSAILTGCGIIAVAIVAAAYVIPERLPDTSASSAATPKSVSKPAPNRFQMVKVENGTTWRLDTQTGEITACRLHRDRMLCARSTEAMELPKATPDQLRNQEKERRQAKREERNEMLDRFMAFFERIIKFAQKQAGVDKPSQPDDENSTRL